MLNNTTVLKGNDTKRKWHLIDLEGKTLGRVCTEIADKLMGKSNLDFSFRYFLSMPLQTVIYL